jgi:hypothetical protein
MSKKAILFIVLTLLAGSLFADDFVKTFNTYYNSWVQLVQHGGEWKLEAGSTVTPGSPEIKILDIKNFYIRFVLAFNPDADGNGGPVEFTFATYPRAGKSDMVAESTEGGFGFYEPVAGERKEITAAVLPPDVFSKFFDEKYLDEHDHDFNRDRNGMVMRQSEVEGPEIFRYMLTIPQLGTKTLLSLVGEKSANYPPPANDLIAAVRFRHIELSWDKTQGLFKIARLY